MGTTGAYRKRRFRGSSAPMDSGVQRQRRSGGPSLRLFPLVLVGRELTHCFFHFLTGPLNTGAAGLEPYLDDARLCLEPTPSISSFGFGVPIKIMRWVLYLRTGGRSRNMFKAEADGVVAEKVRLSVEVPAAVCDDCYKRVLKELTKRSKVPGFRPGKNVPEDILIGYVGKEIVKKAVVETILERTLPHAMSSVSGRALEDSIRISTKFPEMENTYSSLKFLRYDVIVEVAPELKWIPEDGYKNLKIVVDIDKEIDAATAAEQEFSRRLKALGALKIVTGRGLELGDVAILDISATTIEQDESTPKTIPSAESKAFQFDTEDGDRVFPNFLIAITGMKRGETKSFPFVFPDSWKQEDLRGVCAQFTVECKELFYRDLPELNDSLAEKILNGCTTIEEVKRILLQNFLELEQTAKEQATDNAILDQLHKMVEVEIPPSLFEEQGRQLYGAQLLQIQANRKLDEKQLASLSSPKAVKNFLENNRENITSIIKQNLAVGDIFKRENLQILTDDLVKEIENSTAEFKQHNQEYDEERVKAQVQEVLEGAKVLEWLRERAEIQYITK